MGNICDDIVRLFAHPVVTPGDSIMWVDLFDVHSRSNFVFLHGIKANAPSQEEFFGSR